MPAGIDVVEAPENLRITILQAMVRFAVYRRSEPPPSFLGALEMNKNERGE